MMTTFNKIEEQDKSIKEIKDYYKAKQESSIELLERNGAYFDEIKRLTLIQEAQNEEIKSLKEFNKQMEEKKNEETRQNMQNMEELSKLQSRLKKAEDA